ncbi:hypothetical protein [Nocardioides sp.]|uniref:hypothetical protein n=1 Tax=Nocardioides sp. TaxID=35761 RepID=UPI00286E72DB|nr:hypothetical protein [Nocardioides sp.]
MGWVIDSFLDDRIPRMARHRGHFDQLFITDVEMVDNWAAQTGATTAWLPFGSDVLSQPSMPTERPVDLLRVGRQPEAWDDNGSTALAAERLGLRFSAGPPIDPDPARNQEALLAAMRSSKLTLSFTNLVSPATYTHPTRDYVTGRWTDALASGAAVAGVAPTCEAGTRMLWEDGLVRLPDTDRDGGLDVIAHAVRSWSPEKSDAIHLEALRTLDWRHRFRELAACVDLQSAKLEDEIARLQTRIDSLAGGPRLG